MGLRLFWFWVTPGYNVRKNPALTLAFNKLCRRLKKNNAIIHIARKLLNRIRFVLNNRQPYVVAIVE